MHLFYEHAVPLAVDVSKRALAGLPYRAAEIGLLVLATSTGFIAPGVDVAIVKELGLSRRYHVSWSISWDVPPR